MIPDLGYEAWLFIIAALAAVNCALLGNFLVLRKLSMMGDAISHAVLPGIVLALLVSGGLHPTSLFIGAAVVGILTAVLIQAVTRGGVDEGASMGVVFTSLFALGLIMIHQAHGVRNIDLDPQCVLIGELSLAPTQTVAFLGSMVPRSAIVLGLMLLVNGLFVVLFFKELRITAFDPALATTLGFRSGLMHYVTMTLVAMTAVAAFESVGSILVVALLIVPAATAALLTRRLSVMVWLSVLLALAATALGHLGSFTVPYRLGYDGFNAAGTIAVAGGVLFTLVFAFEPRHGLLGRVIRRVRLAMRIAQEDVLAVLYRREERGDLDIPRPSTTGGLTGWLARKRLVQAERARWEGPTLVLTSSGRRMAEKLMRSHRLWEHYMADRVGLRADHTHRAAEDLEHVTDEELRERLAAGAPATDPQGRPIP